MHDNSFVVRHDLKTKRHFWPVVCVRWLVRMKSNNRKFSYCHFLSGSIRRRLAHVLLKTLVPLYSNNCFSLHFFALLQFPSPVIHTSVVKNRNINPSSHHISLLCCYPSLYGYLRNLYLHLCSWVWSMLIYMALYSFMALFYSCLIVNKLIKQWLTLNFMEESWNAIMQTVYYYLVAVCYWDCRDMKDKDARQVYLYSTFQQKDNLGWFT